MADNGTGIGAAVKRKEDIRFITGAGRYTADIDQAGQAYAVFLRAPHARAAATCSASSTSGIGSAAA